MNVSELNGPLLDYWAGKAEGKPVWIRGNHCFFHDQYGVDFPYSPSTDWAQGGPLLESYAITVTPISDAEWQAEEHITGCTARGFGYLESAVRCLVAAKFGEEVGEL